MKTTIDGVLNPLDVMSLSEGTVVWVQQITESGNFVEPLISDGKGNLGNFNLGISVNTANNDRFRYWRYRPTKRLMEAAV